MQQVLNHRPVYVGDSKKCMIKKDVWCTHHLVTLPLATKQMRLLVSSCTCSWYGQDQMEDTKDIHLKGKANYFLNWHEMQWKDWDLSYPKWPLESKG